MQIFWILFLSLLGIVIGFILYAGFVGFLQSTSSAVVCPAGYRALSVDGSRSKIPKTSADLVVTDSDFPICAPMLSCLPLGGLQYAVHRDGSSLTNSCDTPGCACSVYQHCPAFVNVVFREFGSDQRISYFQVIDPTANPPPGSGKTVTDPFDPPYTILQGSRDVCFLNPTTYSLLWPPVPLGQPCLRGIMAKLDPSTYLCAPDAYVDTGTFQFDVERYMANYRV